MWLATTVHAVLVVVGDDPESDDAKLEVGPLTLAEGQEVVAVVAAAAVVTKLSALEILSLLYWDGLAERADEPVVAGIVAEAVLRRSGEWQDDVWDLNFEHIDNCTDHIGMASRQYESVYVFAYREPLFRRLCIF